LRNLARSASHTAFFVHPTLSRIEGLHAFALITEKGMLTNSREAIDRKCDRVIFLSKNKRKKSRNENLLFWRLQSLLSSKCDHKKGVENEWG
jgi:hypothetical protein